MFQSPSLLWLFRCSPVSLSMVFLTFSLADQTYVVGIFTAHLEESDNLSYLFRLRAVDAAGNAAKWSNIVSASFVKPSTLEWPVSKIKYTCNQSIACKCASQLCHKTVDHNSDFCFQSATLTSIFSLLFRPLIYSLSSEAMSSQKFWLPSSDHDTTEIVKCKLIFNCVFVPVANWRV